LQKASNAMILKTTTRDQLRCILFNHEQARPNYVTLEHTTNDDTRLLNHHCPTETALKNVLKFVCRLLIPFSLTQTEAHTRPYSITTRKTLTAVSIPQTYAYT
jgi:hypothetical protein